MNPLIIRTRNYSFGESGKRGLYLHFEKGIHPYVRSWIIIYAKWLRQTLEFPIRVNVYCKACEKIKCLDGGRAYANIIISDNCTTYPRIGLGCGSFLPDADVSEQMIQETWQILFSFSHEIVHYFQMLNGLNLGQSRGIEWQASFWAKRLLSCFDSLYDEDEQESICKEPED